MDESKEQRWLRLYREAYGKPGVLPNHDSPMWVFAAAVERDALARPSPSEEALSKVKNGVEAIQRHVEAGGANEELTAATVICSQVIDYIAKALSSSAPVSEAKP